MIDFCNATSLSSAKSTLTSLKADETRIAGELMSLKAEQPALVVPIKPRKGRTPRSGAREMAANARRISALEAALELNLKQQQTEAAAVIELDKAVNPPKRWLPQYVFGV